MPFEHREYKECEVCGGRMSALASADYPSPFLEIWGADGEYAERLSSWRATASWQPIEGACLVCGGCLNAPGSGLDREDRWRDCRHCKARLFDGGGDGRRQPGRAGMFAVQSDGANRKSDQLHIRLVEEIGQLVQPVSFATLKTHLREAYLSYNLPDGYLRHGVERAIEEGLIVVELGTDGVARYRLTKPAPLSHQGSMPANKKASRRRAR